VEENQIQNEEVVDKSTDVVDEDVKDKEVNDSSQEEQKIYTQEDIDKLQAQIDELMKYKPKEKSEQEIALEEKAKELWKKEVSFTLKEEGLEMFEDFINVEVDDKETLNKQIKKLKEIVGKLELSNTYQPSDHKPVDPYSIAKKNKDSIGMIKNKLKF